MRTILIIQAVIILLGSYYIYTLSHVSPDTAESAVDARNAIPNQRANSSGSDSNEQQNEGMENTSVSELSPELEGLTGNDLGMEYPIIDTELEANNEVDLQVR